MSRTAGLVACLSIFLSGCVVGPNYERPPQRLPPAFYLAKDRTPAPSIADLGWWQLFGDPRLLALIERALQNNLDLQVAAARVREARAQVTLAGAPGLPSVQGELAGTRSNQNLQHQPMNNFQVGIGFSWELDLWGKYARASEGARAQLLATEAGRKGVQASLAASVAQDYLQIASLNEQLAIVERTGAAERESLRLVELLARQGLQTSIEVAQAQSQLLTTLNQEPILRRQKVQFEFALATLLSESPRTFDAEGVDSALILSPELPTGLPGELLERRPDIIAAEQQLVAANANIGVARAQFFPALSLGGLAGQTHSDLGSLLSGAGISGNSLTAGLLAPIYSGGALVANERVAQSEAEQAKLNYQHTILTALQEVSTALNDYREFAEQTKGNEGRRAASGEALRLADLRLRAGVSGYLDVLDAQRQLFAAETDLANSRLNRQLSAIQLYLALGGGWQTPAERPADVASGNSPPPAAQ